MPAEVPGKPVDPLGAARGNARDGNWRGTLPQALARAPSVVRYALAGGAAAVVDIGGFHTLSLAGLPVLPAAVLSFLLAACVNYLLSARWVFGPEWRSLRRAASFLFGACLGLTVNAGSTTALALVALWPPLAAKVAGVGIAFGVNFAINALWVFGQAARAPTAGAPGAAARRKSRLRRRRRDACAVAPATGDRTRRRAGGAAAWPPPPSARE